MYLDILYYYKNYIIKCNDGVADVMTRAMHMHDSKSPKLKPPKLKPTRFQALAPNHLAIASKPHSLQDPAPRSPNPSTCPQTYAFAHKPRTRPLPLSPAPCHQTQPQTAAPFFQTQPLAPKSIHQPQL